jgi:hypothetical protein
MRNHSERDRILDAAIRAGKFREDRRAMYATMYDADPKGAKAIIDQMPGLPEHLRDDPEAYETAFLTPAERERITAAPRPSGGTPATKPKRADRTSTAHDSDEYPQGVAVAERARDDRRRPAP